MSDREEMRDRIRDTIRSRASESGVVMASEEAADMAQAIIDDLGLTVRGDECGYHEIHGSYDTRFREG